MTPSQLFDEHLIRLGHLPPGDSQPRARQLRRLVFCLRLAGDVRRSRVFNNYKDGFRFGQLGYDLVEKRGLTRYQARIWMNMGSTVLPWAKHVASGRELVRRAFDARISDWRPDFCLVQLGSTGHDLPGSRRSARRSANGMRKRPRVCQEGAFRPCHRALRSAARPDPDACVD